MLAPHSILWLKLLLAPSLVGLVSILVTRIGARLGGLLAAFPMVSGPVLLLFALEQGNQFAADASCNTLWGTLSLVAYCVVYARVAEFGERRLSPWFCLLAGWLAFLLATLALKAIALPRALAIPAALIALPIGLGLLPKAAPLDKSNASTPPTATRHLGYRMAAAAALVYTLSEGADYLGPAYSGLLTPFPVASTVLLVATHLEQGLDTTIRWLHGFIAGMVGYLAFITTLSLVLVRFGIALGFGMGLVVAALLQLVVAKRE